MFKPNLLLPSCLYGVAITIISSPVFAVTNALQPTEVASIAKATVVRIEPSIAGAGSGVIIGRYQEKGTNVYVVLTAAHVVQRPDDEYNVITPLPQNGGRQRQKITIASERDIQKLPNVDLAIVKFRSERSYAIATIGDSDYTTEGAGVYIAGFPKESAAITKRVFQFTSSLVSSRLDGESVEGEKDTGALEGGYAISYTNVTRSGMSGGPVFDVAGRVVGIHGKGDREEIAGIQASNIQVGGSKTGFNLGIPIRTFLKLIPTATQQLGAKFDASKPGVLPGGGTIALRGNRVVPPTNIIEEEDATNDLIIGKPGNSQNPVSPQQIVPVNTPISPSSPSPSRSAW